MSKVSLLKVRPLLLIVWSALLLSSACRTPGTVTGRGADTLRAVDAAYAKLGQALGISLSGKEDRKLLSEVAGWIGTPYRYGGSDKKGTDCSGFTSSVIKTVYGISLYRSAADQVKNTDAVDRKELRCGDLVFFKISGNKISHVGLYIADNKFVHASTKRGVVVNDLAETYYTKYYCCAGRIRGLRKD